MHAVVQNRRTCISTVCVVARAADPVLRRTGSAGLRFLVFLAGVAPGTKKPGKMLHVQGWPDVETMLIPGLRSSHGPRTYLKARMKALVVALITPMPFASFLVLP